MAFSPVRTQASSPTPIQVAVLLPAILLIVYIGFLGWWFHSKSKAPVVWAPVVPAVPVQTYSPDYRDATKCFDCQNPSCPYRQRSHGQPKLTPGF
jgi:hypothetical protein